MIHIIGTAHSLQCWSDAIKSDIDCDVDLATVERFERYLRDAALSLRATAIAEELSEQSVRERQAGHRLQNKLQAVWDCVICSATLTDSNAKRWASQPVGTEKMFGRPALSHFRRTILP